MLAKEIQEPFDDKEWLFEIKWDGYRAISEVQQGQVALYSRNGNSFYDHYPSIVEALKQLKIRAILDGEIVVLDESGKSNFQKLQHYEENTQYPLCYYVFDLLQLNGKDTVELPLTDRKALLKKLIPANPQIRYSDHIMQRGIDFFKVAVHQDMEGIMAKKAGSIYQTGRRSDDWLKIKNHKSAEVIIVGFTKPTGSRKYFGALVLAISSGNKMLYAGHTGSGFSDQDLHDVYQRLKPLVRKTSAFNEPVKTNAPVTWVKPALIAEVKFTEWTNDNKMRHPIFLRLRDDKKIKEVTMANAGKPTGDTSKEKELAFGRTKVALTNLDKIFWPGEGITKGMVIDYYQQMAALILPYLKNRPQSLKRNPNGIADKGFFQKDAGDAAPAWVKSKSFYAESAKKDIDYIICNDAQTLAYLNNLGCIELNPWNSTTRTPGKPDYLVIDIDPSEKNSFDQVIETANAFKELLDSIKAPSFCKTSGATGMHIFIPMGHRYTYEQVKDFAHLLCTRIHEQLPAFTSLERSLSKRGNKKIYLDYLQNRRGQTIASVYSIRPHTGATVSTPLLWKEVKKGLSPAAFTIHTVPARVKKMKDIFSGVLGKAVDIKKCLQLMQTLETTA